VLIRKPDPCQRLLPLCNKLRLRLLLLYDPQSSQLLSQSLHLSKRAVSVGALNRTEPEISSSSPSSCSKSENIHPSRGTVQSWGWAPRACAGASLMHGNRIQQKHRSCSIRPDDWDPRSVTERTIVARVSRSARRLDVATGVKYNARPGVVGGTLPHSKSASECPYGQIIKLMSPQISLIAE
jgi:hypothetical protein